GPGLAARAPAAAGSRGPRAPGGRAAPARRHRGRTRPAGDRVRGVGLAAAVGRVGGRSRCRGGGSRLLRCRGHPARRRRRGGSAAGRLGGRPDAGAQRGHGRRRRDPGVDRRPAHRRPDRGLDDVVGRRGLRRARGRPGAPVGDPGGGAPAARRLLRDRRPGAGAVARGGCALRPAVLRLRRRGRRGPGPGLAGDRERGRRAPGRRDVTGAGRGPVEV
ncbi:MAG: hypothetical protein AVDCRST_MAG57-1437, partial [uncultured Blastococcus sp.]